MASSCAFEPASLLVVLLALLNRREERLCLHRQLGRGGCHFCVGLGPGAKATILLPLWSGRAARCRAGQPGRRVTQSTAWFAAICGRAGRRGVEPGNPVAE